MYTTQENVILQQVYFYYYKLITRRLPYENSPKVTDLTDLSIFESSPFLSYKNMKNIRK